MVALLAVAGLSAAALLFVVASAVSPWPGAMVVRTIFELGGMRQSRLLEPHVPGGVSSVRDVPYDRGDPDALLDVYVPSALADGETLPAIVWVHGGAWVSGGRWQMCEYASILAASGYAVVVVGYSLAPEAIYPVALNQVNTALGFLGAEGSRLHVDGARVVLAGDSAGAQIAAQLANAVTWPDYARTIGISPQLSAANLRGAVLFSGAYDLGLIDLRGVTGLFVRSVLWAYTGSADFATDPCFASASVVHHLSADFPPTFISAGDADPLLAHSLAFADALDALGVDVHRLFFNAEGRSGHNYQFDLDAKTGRIALAELLIFLQHASSPK